MKNIPLLMKVKVSRSTTAIVPASLRFRGKEGEVVFQVDLKKEGIGEKEACREMDKVVNYLKIWGVEHKVVTRTIKGGVVRVDGIRLPLVSRKL